jgi:hypothetical protein
MDNGRKFFFQKDKASISNTRQSMAGPPAPQIGLTNQH